MQLTQLFFVIFVGNTQTIETNSPAQRYQEKLKNNKNSTERFQDCCKNPGVMSFKVFYFISFKNCVKVKINLGERNKICVNYTIISISTN